MNRVTKYARKLEELAGGGSLEARVTALRALGKLRSLDPVPTLIFALADENLFVMREARDSLRRISRRFDGFGLPDDPTDVERRAAINKWQDWYLAVDPNAEFEE